MYSGTEMVGFIGKSSVDSAVKALLVELGFTKPLKKPKRGEEESHVAASEYGVELIFQLAETLPGTAGDAFQEGELVLSTIFFNAPGEDDDVSGWIFSDLPKALTFATSRAQARAKFGEPEWIGDEAELWVIDNVQFHITFNDEGSAIEMLTVSLVG